MIICPYCKSNIEEINSGKTCPICGEMVKSTELIQELADACIRILRKNSSYEQIVKYILCENFDAATERIRGVIGRTDIAVEPVIISTILSGSPNLLKPVQQTHTKEQTQQPKIPVGLTACPVCSKHISTCAETCPNCGHPTGVHVCPKCGSTNTKAISGASKAASIFLWGSYAANKVMSSFQCKDCGHKF